MLNNFPTVNLFTPLLLTTALSFALTGCGSDSSTPVTSQDEAQFGLWLTDLADNVIVPGYQDLQSAAQTFSAQSDSFCALATPTDTDLQNLQESWSEVNSSWQSIQWLKIGPVLEESRLFRIALWPDDKDSVTSDLEAILLEPEINADLFSSKYVGGQGIPALEILLFGSDSLVSANDKAKRCEAVTAISENLVNISTNIINGWEATGGDYAATLKAGTDDFTGKKDAVEELVTNWLEQVEKVKDEKLLQPLGDNAPGLPNTAEFTLADEVVNSIRANITSFKQIYSAGNGHGFDNILTDHFDQQAISDSITAQLLAIETSLNALDDQMTFEQQLNDDTSRVQITEVIQKIRELRDLITADFIQAADINIGFNSNDGD